MARTPRHHLFRPIRPAARLFAAVSAGALLLAGCTGGEPEPDATASELPLPASVTASPSASESASPSPSPTGPEKPERPAAMDTKDSDGAAAAVEYILALEQPMMVTGDTNEWGKHSHRACEFCAARLDQAETIAERGDTYTGGELRIIVDTVYQRDVVTGIWPIDVTIRQHATTITDSSDAIVFESEAVDSERRAEVGIRDGEWVLVGMGPIPAAEDS